MQSNIGEPLNRWYNSKRLQVQWHKRIHSSYIHTYIQIDRLALHLLTASKIQCK